MAKIEKSLSTKKDTNGKSRLMLRVVYTHGVMFRLKTPVFVTPSLFDAKAGEVIVPRKSKSNAAVYDMAVEESAAVKSFISRIETILATELPEGVQMSKDYVEHILELQDDKNINLATDRLTTDRIEAAIKMSNRGKAGELATTDDEELPYTKAIENYAKNVKLCPKKIPQYYGLLNKILRFEAYKSITEHKTFIVRLKDMNLDMLNEIRDYIKNEYDLSIQYPKVFEKISNIKLYNNMSFRLCKIGENSIVNLFHLVKAVLNWYIAKGVNIDKSISKFEKGKPIYGRPIYITKEERNKIADYDLSGEIPIIQMVRDLFVLQCLIGCRYGDLMRLKQNNVTNGVLEYVPNKTKDHVQQTKPRIPLSLKAIEIINKYKDIVQGDRLMPYIKLHNYNHRIRQVFEACGITRNVIVRDSLTGMNEVKPICEVASSHMARRAFVGACFKAVKDPNLIGAMSGHVPGSTAFNRYRDIDDDDLREVIACID